MLPRYPIVPIQSAKTLSLAVRTVHYCHIFRFSQGKWLVRTTQKPCQLGPAPRDLLEVAGKQTTMIGSLRTA